MLLFTGGSQFAFVSIIGAGGVTAAPAAIATSSMLGIRNGLYGLQTSRFLGVPGLRRVAAAHLTIDESTAVGIGQPEPDARNDSEFWATVFAVFVLWNSPPWRARSSATRSATPAPWVWMPPLPPPSSRCSGRACAAVTHRHRGAGHRHRAVTSPLLPSGVPVILAAAAALVVACAAPAATRARSRAPTAASRVGPHAMTLWVAVVVASVASLLIKLAGYLVPESLLAGERTSRVTLLPVALLAALVVVQTVVGPGGALVLDARIVAVGVAVVLLLLRANFLVIVLAAGATAAPLRALG